MKHSLFPLLYGFLLAAFTLYLLLDTFIIVRVYDDAMQPEGTPQTDLQPTSSPAVITDRSYTDANIHITITPYRIHETTIHVADVVLTSPILFRTALAQGVYGRNISQKTSEMAAGVGAILAVNGDFYGSRERGYVARNGILYRSSVNPGTQALAIMSDGGLRVVQEGTVSAESLMADGAVHILSFGPALILDGEIAVTAADEVGKAMADNPRTALGMISPGHYVLLVSDGRTRESKGLTLLELAEFMQDLGVTIAYNLDGGGSSTMVFMGEVINAPTTNGRHITERSVSDIVFIGY